MNEKPKSRNRLRDVYQENMLSLGVDYAILRRRLLDLHLASIRHAIAIDALLRRLQSPAHARLGP